jgi:hypothetical protein
MYEWVDGREFSFKSKKGNSFLMGSHIIDQLITSPVYCMFLPSNKTEWTLLVLKLEKKGFQKVLEMTHCLGDPSHFPSMNSRLRGVHLLFPLWAVEGRRLHFCLPKITSPILCLCKQPLT